MATNKSNMKAVIFAGGVGTRMWPLSRKSTPKQFEKIVGEKNYKVMIEEAIKSGLPFEDAMENQYQKWVSIMR